MGMREKLIELVLRMDITDNAGNIVDFLIANGVTIPVRCKDCIHYDFGVCLKIYSDGAVSQYAWQARKEDDFCSYGERRTDERKAD